MGLFTNKPKKNKYKPPKDEDMFFDFYDTDDDIDESANGDTPTITSWEEKAARVKAPHAFTAEEIIKDTSKGSPESPTEPETSLFKRVVEKASQKQTNDNNLPTQDNHSDANTEIVNDFTADIFTMIEPTDDKASTEVELHIKAEPLAEVETISMDDLFTPTPKTSAEADSAITSLLEKCSSYINDMTEPESVEDIEITVPKVEPASGDVDDIISAAEQKANNRIKATYGDISLSEDATALADETALQGEKKAISVDYAVLTPDESESIITSDEPSAPTETIVMESVTIKEETLEEPQDATKVIDLENALNTDNAYEPALDATTAFVMPNAGTEQPADAIEDIFSDSGSTVNNGSKSKVIYEKESTLEELYSEYGDGSEEENDLGFTPPVKEYESLSDTVEIKGELLKRKKASAMRVATTAIIALLSLIVSIPSVCLSLGLDGTSMSVLHLVLLAATVAINFKTVVSVFGVLNGITKFDYVVALGAFSVVVHSVATVCIGGGNRIFLTAAAATALAFNELGNYLKTSSILNGFSQITSSDKKKAVVLFDNDNTAKSITANNIEGDVLLAASRKTVTVENFIKNSYSPTPFDKNAPKIMLISVIAAIVAAIATFSFTSNTQYALTVLPLSLCLVGGVPLAFSAGNFLNILSNTVSKKCGGMVAGYKAVEQLSNCNAVSLDATDIFPKGTVISNDMRIISMNQIDETLTNAVALAVKAKSPISGMLKNLLGNDVKEFPEVDSYKYENEMGISGWVNNNFVLIGNRDLISAHNIKLPSVSVDNKILKAGYFPIYIASNEKACALLIVSYHVNKHVSFDLINACNLGLTVFVKSTDPNITAKMISDYFGVYDDFICVLNKRNAKLLTDNTASQEKCPAVAAFRGSAHSLLKMITAACSIRGCLKFLTVVAAIIAAIGVFSAVYSSASTLFPVIAAAAVPVAHIIYWAINAAVSALNKKIR